MSAPANRGVMVAVALAYFAVCAAIAIWAARRTRTREDFFLAGRGIGLWAMTMAAMAATLSGFIFVGAPGLLYEAGIGALFISLSASITTPMSAWLLAAPLWRMRHHLDVITVPDAVRLRYRSRLAQGVCAVAIVVACVGYIATNLLALAVVVHSAFGLSISIGVWLAAGLVVAYTATGGILAGVYTDVFQGTIKACASVLVFVVVLRAGHGLGGISRTLITHDASFMGPWGHLSPVAAFSLFFLFGIGTLGQPQVISKYFMLRDPDQLRWYPMLMTAVLLLSLLLFIGVGLGARAAVAGGEMPPLQQRDEATPALLLLRAAPWLTALVFSGIAAAVMGTVNAFLSVGSAAVTHDLPTALDKPVANELAMGRYITVALAVVAAIVAAQRGAAVALLGIFGWGLFASTLVPSLALGLNWPGATRSGAIASMSVGMISTLGLEAGVRYHLVALPSGVSGSAMGLALALVVFLVVSQLTRTPESDLMLDQIHQPYDSGASASR